MRTRFGQIKQSRWPLISPRKREPARLGEIVGIVDHQTLAELFFFFWGGVFSLSEKVIFYGFIVGVNKVERIINRTFRDGEWMIVFV